MHPFYSIPMFVTSASVAALGLFVFWKRPKERLNQLFALLAWSLSQWTLGYGLVYCTTDPVRALELVRWAYIGIVFIPTFFVHFMEVFLRLSQKFLIGLCYFLSCVFLYVTRLDVFMEGVRTYFWGFYPKAGSIHWTFLLFFYGAFGYCVYQFSRAYFEVRRSGDLSSPSAQRLKYVFWANCVASLSVTDYMPKYGLEVYPCAYLAAMGWLALMSYAVLKYRLMDVQLVIRKTLIYSFVSAVLTSIYFLTVTLLANLSSGLVGRSSWLSFGVASLVITVTFLPLFRRVQSIIDRLFFRFQIDRETKLVEFSSEIIQQENTERLTQSLCRVLEDALHPKTMGLYLRTTGVGDYLEVSGRIPKGWAKVIPAANPWAERFRKDAQPIVEDSETQLMGVRAAVPLLSREDVLGFLLLGEKRSEEPYTNEDLILLRIIANQATVAYERPKLLQEVSGGFVHEIKMPISKISLPAELTYLEIEQALEGKKAAEELLPRIQRRMKYIMDQAFLASHRVEALQHLGSTEPPKREPVHLSEVVRSSSESVEDVIKQSKSRLTVTLSEDVPPVLGDPRQLEIVFVNLLKNAAEAMADLPSENPREIRIKAHVEDSHVIVRVTDTGPGVKPEDAERIFQPQYTTKGPRGAGMGLFLCRQIVQAHKGSIELHGEPGKGATLTVKLPA